MRGRNTVLKLVLVTCAALVCFFLAFDYFGLHMGVPSCPPLPDSARFHLNETICTPCPTNAPLTPPPPPPPPEPEKQEPEPQTELQAKADAEVQRLTGALPCIPKIRESLRTAGYPANFDSTFVDMLDLFLTYGATVGARERFIEANVGRGMYFTSAESLEMRLNASQTCWASDRTRGLQRIGGETIAPKLGICTTTESTSPYIQEWMSHHLLMGFHKIVMHDSTRAGSVSEKRFLKVVAPFVELGFAEVVHDDIFNAPEQFERCRQKLTAEGYHWIAQIDTDEFLMVHHPHPYCFGEFLKQFDDSVEKSPAIGGVAFQWREMSTAGVMRNEKEKVIIEESLYQGHDAHAHLKTVYKTSKVTGISHQHYPNYIKDFEGYDANWKLHLGPFMDFKSEDFSLGELRHFYGRSVEFMFYDKICADNSYNPGVADKRMDAFLRWYKQDAQLVKLEPDARYINPLRTFLFG